MIASENENAFHWFVRLPALEGFGLVLFYLLFPPEVPRTKLLAVLGALFILSALFAGLAWSTWRNPQYRQRWLERLVRLSANRALYWLILILAGLGAVSGVYFIVSGARLFDMTIAYFSQLFMPLVAWLWLVSLQTLVILRLLRHGTSLSIFREYKGGFLASVFAGAILILVIILMVWSRVGLTRDQVGWGVPAAPLLAYQVSFALVVTLAVAFLGRLLRPVGKMIRDRQAPLPVESILDILIGFSLWFSAALIWHAQPLAPAWFADKPAPPNMEYYPASDAIHYDLSAQVSSQR